MQAALCERMERSYRDGVVLCCLWHDVVEVEPDAEKAAHFCRLRQRYQGAVRFPWNWLANGQAGCDAQLRLMDAQLRILFRDIEAKKKREDAAPMNLSYFEYGEDGWDREHP
jgi:hypothetical protein